MCRTCAAVSLLRFKVHETEEDKIVEKSDFSCEVGCLLFGFSQ